jgi:hypothetical protein
MHRLITRVAAVALAGTATLATVGSAAPAAATTEGGGLVNIYATNLLSNNQIVLVNGVSVPIAAAVCGVDANVLSTQLQEHGKADCPAKSTSLQKAWVGYN